MSFQVREILETEEELKFLITGLAGASEFQVCVAYAEVLHKKFPKVFTQPEIRTMLEFDWFDHLKKIRQEYGGILWQLNKAVVVFIKEQCIGDNDDFIEFISNAYYIKLNRDYACLAQSHVLDIYWNYMDIGLFADLVPKTCERFVRNCKKRDFYEGVLVHRIMKNSWIQFGGFDLKPKCRPCENYKIPHNRRGILSLCNDGRHTNNTTQFFLTLGPTPWMDYKYVAFGQIVEGYYVLERLESLETMYESPLKDIVRISKCGELTLENVFEIVPTENIQKIIDRRQEGNNEIDIADKRDNESVLSERSYIKGNYFYVSDVYTKIQLNNLPSSSYTKSTCSCDDEYEDAQTDYISEISPDVLAFTHNVAGISEYK